MNHKEMVLVTGGAGFIGSHLVDALIKKGYKVRVIDNLTRPTHNGKLPDYFNKKAEFIKGDVRKKRDLIKVLKGVDYVFHLAGYMDYHLDFSTFIDTNIKSSALIYEVILQKKLNVKKIIVISSQSVYGEGKFLCPKHGVFYAEPRSEEQLKKHQWKIVCPKDGKPAKLLPEEETDEFRPQIPYGISKVATETLSMNLGKTFKIPTVVIRFSIVQGSHQSFRHFNSGAIRAFCVRALAGFPMPMIEDGLQFRDFVNVHDAVDALLLVMKNRKADYEIFNVGSGKNTTIRQLAKTVSKITKSSVEAEVTQEYRLNTPRDSSMSIAKIKKLGFSPKRSLEDNVKEYVEWVKFHPEAIKFWNKTRREMRKKKILKG